MVLVKGTPAMPGRSGRLVDLIADDEVSGALKLVEPDDEVLRVVPPGRGKDGVDVFGRTIPAPPGRPARLCLGEGVQLSEDGATVVATSTGRFSLIDGLASVQPQLTIDAETNLPRQPLRFDGDIHVEGDLAARADLHTGHDLLVQGAIEGATIQAGRSVEAVGILGRGRGTVTAGGDIRCQFSNGACLRAGRDVIIHRYCYDSTIRCGGRLQMEHAVLSGGRVSAANGATVGTIGTKMHRCTMVAIGVDETVTGHLARLERAIVDATAQLTELTHEYAPYARRLEVLRGIERETAHDLRTKMIGMSTLITTAQAEMEGLRGRLNERSAAPLIVHDRIAAGVQLEFQGVLVTLREEIIGPLRVELHRSAGETRVVATQLDTMTEEDLPWRGMEHAA
jgi:uncharacterized protein (DUF342 family)